MSELQVAGALSTNVPTPSVRADFKSITDEFRPGGRVTRLRAALAEA